MAESADSRTEEQLLEAWYAADARMRRMIRSDVDPAWKAALADEWRARSAYRQAVQDRLRREREDAEASRRLRDRLNQRRRDAD